MFFIFFTLKWNNHGENSFSIVNYVFSSFMGFELGENLYDILLLICCPFFLRSLCVSLRILISWSCYTHETDCRHTHLSFLFKNIMNYKGYLYNVLLLKPPIGVSVSFMNLYYKPYDEDDPSMSFECPFFLSFDFCFSVKVLILIVETIIVKDLRFIHDNFYSFFVWFQIHSLFHSQNRHHC